MNDPVRTALEALEEIAEDARVNMDTRITAARTILDHSYLAMESDGEKSDDENVEADEDDRPEPETISRDWIVDGELRIPPAEANRTINWSYVPNPNELVIRIKLEGDRA